MSAQEQLQREDIFEHARLELLSQRKRGWRRPTLDWHVADQLVRAGAAVREALEGLLAAEERCGHLMCRWCQAAGPSTAEIRHDADCPIKAAQEALRLA